mgnify:CR=1 FL=1
MAGDFFKVPFSITTRAERYVCLPLAEVGSTPPRKGLMFMKTLVKVLLALAALVVTSGATFRYWPNP